MKQLTAPPAPPLVTVFQWSSPTEVVTNEFTDALLDVCNYKLLMTLQDKCDKIDCQETMNDEGSCIRIRSLVTALKGKFGHFNRQKAIEINTLLLFFINEARI